MLRWNFLASSVLEAAFYLKPICENFLLYFLNASFLVQPSDIDSSLSALMLYLLSQGE